MIQKLFALCLLASCIFSSQVQNSVAAETVTEQVIPQLNGTLPSGINNQDFNLNHFSDVKVQEESINQQKTFVFYITTLPANGYEWILDQNRPYDNSIITPINTVGIYIPNTTKAKSLKQVTGRTAFAWTASAPGTTDIAFLARRKSDQLVTTTITLRLTVNQASQ